MDDVRIERDLRIPVRDGTRHPEDATPRRLETGCETRVFNDRGAFVAQVEVTPRVRPGVIASTKGRWPRLSKDARPSTPPWTSETPTWAAAPSFTTTASRSSASSLEPGWPDAWVGFH